MIIAVLAALDKNLRTAFAQSANITAYRFHFDETVHRDGVLFRDLTWSTVPETSDVTGYLKDPPGVAAPGSALETRRIPGGGPADLYPDFGGAIVYGNNKGSFRAHLATGVDAGPGVTVSNYASTDWEGDFIKGDEAEPFRFHVNPGVLRLVDGRSVPFITSEDLEASWHLQAKVEGITQFEVSRKLRGRGSLSSMHHAVASGEFEDYYRVMVETGPSFRITHHAAQRTSAVTS